MWAIQCAWEPNKNVLCSFLFQLQAYQLVLDDIMDNAITRRGRPCWYRHNDIGLMAVNDGILLEQAIYQLLKKHFKDKPYYTHIVELFYDV